MGTAVGIHDLDLEGLQVVKKGKVRNVYAAGDHLVIAATDRLSAFDFVLPDPIPYKGIVLTQLSNFWFARTVPLAPNHVLDVDAARFPAPFGRHLAALRHRAVLVRRTTPFPIEFVVRGYLAGGGWSAYRETGAIGGIPLPPGLAQNQRLPQPILTPATKAETGHDVNITEEEAARRIGEAPYRAIREMALAVYGFAHEGCEREGILLADTKMEFGQAEGEILLIDELLTPDSSRYWAKETYAPGRRLEAFDKQFVRDYLIERGLREKLPGVSLPPDIITKTSELYIGIYERITKEPFFESLGLSR